MNFVRPKQQNIYIYIYILQISVHLLDSGGKLRIILTLKPIIQLRWKPTMTCCTMKTEKYNAHLFFTKFHIHKHKFDKSHPSFEPYVIEFRRCYESKL